MASWWTGAEVLDDLELEQNPIMTRVIQAVGMFGDILSLEETMEPVLSADGQGSWPEEESSGEEEEETAGGSQEERVMVEEERGHSVTFERGELGESVIEGDTGENEEMEKSKVEQEDENKGWERSREEDEHNEEGKVQMSVNDVREEEQDSKKQGMEEDKNNDVKETEEEKVETKEQQNKEEQKDEEFMTLETENEVNTEGEGDEEKGETAEEKGETAEEKGETAEEKGEMAEEDEEVLKEERKDERKRECGKHEEEKLDKKQEGEKNEVKKERREMEKEQLDEDEMGGEETMATQGEEKENDATLDGGETKLDPNQLKPPSAEAHHSNANETGSEALSGHEEEGWDAAQDRDICPASESVDEPRAEVSSDLQPDSRTEEKVSLWVDAVSQMVFVSGSGSKEHPPTQDSPATRSFRRQVKEVKGNKEKEDQIGKMAATQPGYQLSKYKSMSYKKIRKGNTRQKIDKFESRKNL